MEEYRATARRRWAEAQQPGAPREKISGNSSARTAAAQQRPAADNRGGDGILDELQRWWAQLPQDQQYQILAIGGLVFLVLVVGQRIVPLLALGALLLYLRAHIPTQASFDHFFERWFTQDYFPRVSQKIQRELQERSKKENLFAAMGSQLKGWVMGKTESLQASVWYETTVKFALPARFANIFFMRTATVNLGSRARPCHVTFWGIYETWMLSPLVTIDFENVSLLNEISRQGIGTQ
mmetsp:Transcript_31356/g.86204  ORF Transcript_31356/g.86204 Transcript_31356/m.86204 type:complete len:238 (-) Transcript_31356:118-831(-)